MSITPPPPYSDPGGYAVVEPDPPSLRVDLAILPKLISPPVVLEHIAPWIDPSLQLAKALQRDDTPQWSLWLESYYRMYHPDTWIHLEKDHERQKDYLFRLGWYYMRKESEGSPSNELDEIWKRMESVQDELLKRISKLYGEFYPFLPPLPSLNQELTIPSSSQGLYHVRQRFLATWRLASPDRSDDELLREYSTKERHRKCQHATHSVWPLPRPFPSQPVHPLMPGQAVGSIAFLSKATLDARYALPWTESPFISRLRAVFADIVRPHSTESCPRYTESGTVCELDQRRNL